MQIQFVFRKVVDTYKAKIAQRKRSKRHLCHFRDMGSIPYNHIICSYQNVIKVMGDKNVVPHISIASIAGRLKVKYVITNYTRHILANIIPDHFGGEGKLVFRNGNLYLTIPVSQCGPWKMITPKHAIGVDLRENSIATLSYGRMWNDDNIEKQRLKYHTHQSSLQKCGTKSAKRRLKRVYEQESRFRRDINHCISKELVTVAKGTRSCIVLEQSTHTREQKTVRRQQRASHHRWNLVQLRTFITYKAQHAGVVVNTVDLGHIGLRCSHCNLISCLNRRDQYMFNCRKCKFHVSDDYNTAQNLMWFGNNNIP